MPATSMSCRIATFNLKDFFLPRNDAERGVGPGKLVNLADNLRRANADVVALQEVGEEQQLDRIVERDAVGCDHHDYGRGEDPGVMVVFCCVCHDVER